MAALIVPPGCPLAPRQYETVVRIMRGATYRQAARDMGIELSTARTHLHYAYERLGVGNARQAYTVMLRHDWFDRGELPADYDGKPYTIRPNWGLHHWLPTPAQRLYLDAFDRLLRDRSDEAAADVDFYFRVLCRECHRPDTRPGGQDIDEMLARLAWAALRPIPVAA